MMRKRKGIFQGILAIGFLAIVSGCGSAPSAKQKPGLLAFYYPWYGTPYFSGQWRHWNEAGHNPDVINSLGFRDIGTTDYPYPDVYDSNDTMRIAWQLDLARRAGIDGFIVSWWGINSFEDNALKKVLAVDGETQAPLKIALYYEIVPGQNIADTISDITYINSNYFGLKNYLKYQGKPVLFVYGRAIFPSQWCTGDCPPGTPAVIDWSPVIKAFPNVIFVGDAMAYFMTDYSVPLLRNMGFQGIHIYNPVLDIKLGSDMSAAYGKFTGLAKKDGLLSALTVIPGYNDTNIGRTITSVVNRDNGKLYTMLANDALKTSPAPDWILITTFNEWHEGSEIEPSYQYGDQYIDLTKTLFQ